MCSSLRPRLLCSSATTTTTTPPPTPTTTTTSTTTTTTTTNNSTPRKSRTPRTSRTTRSTRTRWTTWTSRTSRTTRSTRTRWTTRSTSSTTTTMSTSMCYCLCTYLSTILLSSQDKGVDLVTDILMMKSPFSQNGAMANVSEFEEAHQGGDGGRRDRRENPTKEEPVIQEQPLATNRHSGKYMMTLDQEPTVTMRSINTSGQVEGGQRGEVKVEAL